MRAAFGHRLLVHEKQSVFMGIVVWPQVLKGSGVNIPALKKQQCSAEPWVTFVLLYCFMAWNQFSWR